MLHLLICEIKASFSLCLDDCTSVGDTLAVGKVLELIMEDGPCCASHLNFDKTKGFFFFFFSKEDPKKHVWRCFPHDIARPLHGVKLLGWRANVDFYFSVMKSVAKTILLMDIVAKINFLNVSCRFFVLVHVFQNYTLLCSHALPAF